MTSCLLAERRKIGPALEPQRFPDAPNRPKFGVTRLNPGETYSNTMVFHLTVDPAPKGAAAKTR